MPIVPFKSYPLADKGMSWSFSASDGNALLESGGWSLFKSVHTWFEGSGTPEVKSAYKLPHHKKVSGEVKTVWRGVVAAMSRLMQAATQIPDSDRRGCYNHLARHYREFDEEPPEYRRYTDEELTEMLVNYGFSNEEIDDILKPLAKSYGKPTQSQLDIINSKLPKGAKPLSSEEVFVFNAKLIGNGLIPDRYHRISIPLMRVFRDNAKDGVAFLLDHSWAGGLFGGRPKPAIPYGKTFDAVLRKLDASEAVGDETHALFADHYIVRGVEIDGISTDSIIRMIETGTLFDTSIGFGADKAVCSICGKDYRSCEHMAGQSYDGVTCEIVWHPPGFLMENSGVFDGAYPGAGILSNGTPNDANLIGIDDLKQIPLDTRIFATYSTNSGLMLYVPRGTRSNKLSIRKEDDKLDKELEAKVAELTAALNEKTELLSATEAKMNELKTENDALKSEIDALKNKVSELEPLAKDGIAFKEFMVQEAHKWGVRAMGNAYKQEIYDKVFSSMSIAEVREIMEQFETKAREEIPTGRKSQASEPANDNALKQEKLDPSDEKRWREAVAKKAAELRKEDTKLSVAESMKKADALLRKEVVN